MVLPTHNTKKKTPCKKEKKNPFLDLQTMKFFSSLNFQGVYFLVLWLKKWSLWERKFQVSDLQIWIVFSRSPFFGFANSFFKENNILFFIFHLVSFSLVCEFITPKKESMLWTCKKYNLLLLLFWMNPFFGCWNERSFRTKGYKIENKK